MTEVAVPASLASVEKMKIFLYQLSNHPSKVHDEVKSAKRCLEILQAYLTDSKDHNGEDSQMLKDCSDIAHDIEDALDEFNSQVAPLFHSNKLSHKIQHFPHILQLRKASTKLSSNINKQIKLVKRLHFEDSSFEGDLDPKASIWKNRTELDLTPKIQEDEMVGFEESKAKLHKQLMEEDSRLLTISIVGPGGSGKTTLVKNLYNMVQGVFDSSYWIDVSRPLKMDDLLLAMLNNFEATTLDLHQEQDPRSKLSLLLQHKRFLLVLDNVWSKKDWEFFVYSLPKGLCGSKIIIITRNSDVASFPVKSSEYIHDLSTGLSSEEAHDLFCKKAFQDGICPPELEECSRKILNKCEGSPFAISTVGTLLATKPQTKNEWEELHDTLTSNFTADSKLWVLSRIFQPCYRELQSHLKSCFLYLGIFPEDYYIRRGRLFRLWVAEGFVEPTAGLTVEEVAEQYLNELIDSNLVQASSWGIDGRVKSCRISNIVRAFIMSQKFVTDSETIWCRQTEVDKVRRLSAHNLIIKYLSNSGIDLNGIRTLQSYKKGSSGLDLNVIRTLQDHKNGNSDSQFAMVLKTTRFLRVLDLQGVPLEIFPSSVVGLTLLKYLSLRKSQIKTVPKSIKKLLFLETLDLKHTRVAHLPEQICKLVRLRHLLVFCNNLGSGGVTLSAGNLGALSSIQNLSLVKVENDRRILRALGKLIGLRKLGLTDVKKEDGVELCCSLQKMENLSSLDVASTSEDEYLDLDHMQSPLVAPLYLERLFLIGRLERVPKWIPELTSLTKILLKWSKVKPHDNSLESLQSLPNLMELTLIQFYTGKELVFKAQTFKKLMILSIEEFDELNSMKVESQAMPMLKKLSISRCQGLDLLPWGITGLIQLEELILSDMPDKFIANLRKHSEALEMMQIRVIHSSNTGSNQSSTRFQDFSLSKWHLESILDVVTSSCGGAVSEVHEDEAVRVTTEVEAGIHDQNIKNC